MKNILRCMIFVVVAFCATEVLAATSAIVDVKAVVPTLTSGLTVTINKIVGGTGGAWSTATSVDFSTLTLDPVNHIFTTGNPGFYYAVDAAVTDNSGNDWSITHARSSLKSGTNNLDGNVNVSFCSVHKVVGAADSDTLMSKVSYNDSNSKVFHKSALNTAGGTGVTGSWLRVYYGLGMGDPAKPDATGVTPIGADKPAGSYAGQVTLTYSAT